MCGLVGMAGDLSSAMKRKAFEDLLTVDVVRGQHSTGVGLVGRWKADGMHVCKTVGPPPELFTLIDYQNMMKKNAKVWIGHNRFATTGKVTDENAHPFLFDNVIGAHNGTLQPTARGKLYNADTFGTDSEAIFANIDKYGFNKTVDIIHNPSWPDNAWALTYYDAEHNTINLTRNTKRPLFYMYSKDQSTLFWASELDMLRWVLRRNHIETFEDKAYQLTEDFHYSWVIPSSIADKFDAPTVTKIERPAPAVSYFSGSASSYLIDTFKSGGTSHSSTESHKNNVIQFLDKKKQARLQIDTKKWKPPYKDHNGMAIGKARIRDKLVGGCTFCPSHKNEGFADKFKWGDFIFFCRPDTDGREVFLCEECYNDEGIRNLCKELI